MSRDQDLNDLMERLKSASGADLRAVILHGSAAGPEFHPGHSDLNVLCIVNKADATHLAQLQPVSRWWHRKGHPAPLIFTGAELRDWAQLFPIEMMDIREQHRTLYGTDDAVTSFSVSTGRHREQLERELRTNLIRLRQAFLRLRGRDDELVELLIDSSSSFATLFRHSLIALGERPPGTRRDTASRLGALLGLDMATFQTVLELKNAPRDYRGEKLLAVFGDYLELVTRVGKELDNLRLAANPA